MALPEGLRFVLETAAQVALAVVLFAGLLRRGGGDLTQMILTGVILGVLFRSLSGVMARVMDPNAFAVVQSLSFASVARADPQMLTWVAACVALCAVALLALSSRLDVMALGRVQAVSLGLGYDRLSLWVLSLSAALVAAVTALVGPVAFLGLIVAALADRLLPLARHALLLPAAALLGVLLLVSGQFLFERVLGLEGALSMVVEFGGGLFFLFLLVKGAAR